MFFVFTQKRVQIYVTYKKFTEKNIIPCWDSSPLFSSSCFPWTFIFTAYNICYFLLFMFIVYIVVVDTNYCYKKIKIFVFFRKKEWFFHAAVSFIVLQTVRMCEKCGSDMSLSFYFSKIFPDLTPSKPPVKVCLLHTLTSNSQFHIQNFS